VLYSIIGWGSRVGAWARVEGSPVPPTSHSTSVVKNGVKVQSITILGKDCGVGDEIRVQNCVCLPYKELKRVCCTFSALLGLLRRHVATASPTLWFPTCLTDLTSCLGCRQRNHYVREFTCAQAERGKRECDPGVRGLGILAVL
jgi:hypothetical protein